MKKILFLFVFIFIGGNIFAQDLKIERSLTTLYLYTKYYEGDQKVSRSEFKAIIKKNPTAYEQYASGRNLYTVGNIIGIPSGVVLGFSLGQWASRNEEPNIGLLTISGLGTLGAMILTSIGEAKIKKGVKIYNGSEKLGLNLNVNENGIGIAFQF